MAAAQLSHLEAVEAAAKVLETCAEEHLELISRTQSNSLVASWTGMKRRVEHPELTALLQAINGSRFTTGDKEKLVGKACELVNMTMRKAMQDYTTLFSYLTQSEWDLLREQGAGYQLKDTICIKKIEMLGGRNIDEWSWKWFASLFTLLDAGSPSLVRIEDVEARRSSLKDEFKKQQKRMQTPPMTIIKLPADPMDLKRLYKEIFDEVFPGTEVPIPAPIDLKQVNMINSMIDCRSSGRRILDRARTAPQVEPQPRQGLTFEQVGNQGQSQNMMTSFENCMRTFATSMQDVQAQMRRSLLDRDDRSDGRGADRREARRDEHRHDRGADRRDDRSVERGADRRDESRDDRRDDHRDGCSDGSRVGRSHEHGDEGWTPERRLALCDEPRSGGSAEGTPHGSPPPDGRSAAGVEDPLRMMRERAASKDASKRTMASSNLKCQADSEMEEPHASPKPGSKAAKKRPAAASPTGVLKKPAAAAAVAAAPAAKVTLETSRNQFIAWTGVRGAGQYKAFRFDSAKSQKKAKTAAHAWLGMASG